MAWVQIDQLLRDKQLGFTIRQMSPVPSFHRACWRLQETTSFSLLSEVVSVYAAATWMAEQLEPFQGTEATDAQAELTRVKLQQNGV